MNDAAKNLLLAMGEDVMLYTELVCKTARGRKSQFSTMLTDMFLESLQLK